MSADKRNVYNRHPYSQIADIKIPAIITDNSLYMRSIAGILLHKQKITLFQTTKIVIILYYIPDLLR